MAAKGLPALAMDSREPLSSRNPTDSENACLSYDSSLKLDRYLHYIDVGSFLPASPELVAH